MSNQVLRSGTSIGALVRESKYAESTKDFIHKLSIAQKESNETLYWLELLHKSEYINTSDFNKISEDSLRILKILTSIITSTKRNNQRT